MPPPRKRPSTPFAPPTRTLQHSLVPSLLLLRNNLSTINISIATCHSTLLSLKTAKAPFKIRENEFYNEYIQCQKWILEMDDREPGRGRRGWMAAMAEWENEMAGAEERFRDVGGELGKVERKVGRFGREKARVKVEIGRLEKERERVEREIKELEVLLGIKGEDTDGEGADGELEIIEGKDERKRRAVEVETEEESDGDGDRDGDSDLDYVEERQAKRPVKRLKKDDVLSRLKATAVVRWD
jgi:chromosome segregation ATPase